MMKHFKKTLVGSLVVLAAAGASGAFAADSADLQVVGVIAPAACTPTFAGGAKVDYGHIPAASISQTAVTELGAKTVNFTIACDGPVSIAMNWLDNRKGTAVTGSGPANVDNAFGLNKQGTANIGRFTVFPTQTTGDGVAVDTILRDNSSSAWVTNNLRFFYHDTATQVSFAPAGTLVPGSFQNYAGVMTVNAGIAPGNTLDLTHGVNLDGLATMLVQYL